jgi:polysaccharide biosynthesis/export protein
VPDVRAFEDDALDSAPIPFTTPHPYGALAMARLSFLSFAALSVIAFNGATAQSLPSPALQSMPPYRINPGDQIEVMVWGDERLKREAIVLPDGTFAFPLVGQVVAAGQLPADLGRLITSRLQPEYKGPVPQVTVSVTKASGYQFSVIGKVRSPGTFTPGRYVNALEAFSIAGGPTEFAQVGNITILRKVGDRLLTMHPRLGAALRAEAGLTGNDVPMIETGDTLVVP